MTIAAHRLAGYSGNRAHLDFYPTPEWATDALFRVEKFEGQVLEPAAGDGAMVKVIEKYNPGVVAKDIVTGDDFLLEDGHYPNVITNPPFKLAPEFIQVAKRVAQKKIALFLKLVFLEGQSRQVMFRDTVFPLARVYVFSKRVNLYPNGEQNGRGSGTMAFAWFIWDKEHSGPATIHWL